MARPEDHINQLLAYDARLSSSLPAGQLAIENTKGSVDNLLDFNDNKEAQGVSLRGHIEDTQFEVLEPETQADDNAASSLSREVVAPSCTISEAVSESPPCELFAVAIERPKGIESDNGTSGFKFAKPPQPPKPGQYNRLPGKTTDASGSVASTQNVSDLAHMNPTSDAISKSSKYLTTDQAPCEEAGCIREGTVVHLKELGTQVSHTTDNLKQNVVSESCLEAERRSLPSSVSDIDLMDPSSTHQRAPTDNIGQTEPTTNIPSPFPVAKLSRTHPAECFQPQSGNVEAKVNPKHRLVPPYNPTTKEAQLHNESSLPQEPITKPSSKNYKHRPMKQPFPEVLPPHLHSNRAPHRHRSNRLTRLLDANKAVAAPDQSHFNVVSPKTDISIDQGRTIPTYKTITDATCCQESVVIPGRLEKVSATIVQNNFSNIGSYLLPTDVILSPGDSRYNQLQRDQTRTVIASNSPATPNSCVDGNSVSPKMTRASSGNVEAHGDSIDNEHYPHLQSRPRSAQSNTAKMRRPLVEDEVLSQGISESAALGIKHAMKVQKVATRFPSSNSRVKSPRHATSSYHGSFTAITSAQGFLRNLPELQHILQEYEDQNSTIESQQAEIEKLSISTTKSKKEFQRLEAEKEVLNGKIKRFSEISAKYKAHMNEVVQAQKHLADEQKSIKKQSNEIRKDTKAATKAYAEREIRENRLQNLILGAKELKPKMEKMQQLEEENLTYKRDLEKAQRINELLQYDLNARVFDLGRERHTIEQLQKSLNAKEESNRELVLNLKKAQTTMMDELTKNGSLLVNMANSEQSTQTRFDELSSFLKTVNSRDAELLPALVQLVEDIYSRIETKLQASEDRGNIITESSLQLLEDLKDRINQLHLDEDTRTHLNERVLGLLESNAALAANNSTWKLEGQSMAKRIDEIGLELSCCRDQLTAKSDEVASLRALPKEDPILLAKIHDLETSKIILQGKFDTVSQDASKSKEELVICQAATLKARENLQESETKLTKAQTTISSLREDLENVIASHGADTERACQEIAKKAQAAKAEAKLQHDSLVTNLEERRAEAEKELALSQKHLQKCQEEQASHLSSFNNIKEELSLCKKQLERQSEYIKDADQICQQIPDRDEFTSLGARLEEALANVSEFRTQFEVTQKLTAKKIDNALVSHQKATEELVEKINTLEKDKAILEKENLEMQNAFETFKADVDQNIRQSDIWLGAASIDKRTSKNAHLPHQIAPPAATAFHLCANQMPSLGSSDLARSQPKFSNIASLGNITSTPQDVLREGEYKIEQVTQHSPTILKTRNMPQESNVASSSLKSHCTSSKIETNTAVSKIVNEASPSNLSTSKQLRPANRKSSSFGKSALIQTVATTINTHGNVLLSTMPNHLSTRRGSITTAEFLLAEVPSDGLQLNTPTKKDIMHTDRPTHPFVDTSSDSSQLSYINSSQFSSADHLGFEEDFHDAQIQALPMESAASRMSTGSDDAPLSHISADYIASVKFNNNPTSFHYSEDHNISEINERLNVAPQLSKTDGRIPSMPLKSAMKKSSKDPDTTSIYDASDVVQIPMSSPNQPPLLVPNPSINQQQATKRPSSMGSSFFGVVAGSKPGSSAKVPSISLATQRSPAKPATSNGDKSPLMRAPLRNLKRRPAQGTSESTKSVKQRRYNSRTTNLARKEGRSVIPDSQEERHHA